ncbi:unnamed protein product [Durusdinium trenchii]|uniref:Uncharacterized protein n=1 Tax=Durusdinium trenchii TaxID=1381693 RepID=A0ABP0HQZ6_9DINO
MDGVSLNMLQVLLAIILAAASISLLTSAGVIHRCPMCPGATGYGACAAAQDLKVLASFLLGVIACKSADFRFVAGTAVVFIAGWCGEVCSGKDMGHLEAEDDKSFRVIPEHSGKDLELVMYWSHAAARRSEERPPQELEVRWLGPRHRPSITWRSSWSSQLVSWAPMPSEGRVEPGEWKVEVWLAGQLQGLLAMRM